MISGVYQIINQLNNKRYIGRSKNIESRFKKHKSQLKNDDHYNSHLQNAWNKYNENVFKFSILIKCREQILVYCEQYWIDKLNTYNKGYNQKPTSFQGTVSGKRNPNWKGKVKVECENCGEIVKTNVADKKRKKFCSKTCQYEYKSESGMYNGENNPFYGKNHNKKSKNLIRKSLPIL